MAVVPSCTEEEGENAGARKIFRLCKLLAAALRLYQRRISMLMVVQTMRSLDGRARTLMASSAYSTWNSLPSGLKVLTPRSYSLLVRNIVSDVPGQVWLCTKNLQPSMQPL